MRTVSYSRSQIHRFYEMPRSQRGTLLEKSASSASSHPFKGAGLYNTAVVRVDLNNYSAWTRRVPITDRVELLDHFFTTTVSLASQLNGVYFRDEGDCVVLLFGSYFGATSFQEMHYFCRQCVLRKFGRDELDAKVSVAIGEVAFFQKSHELNSTDWSAEGEPFVRSARLERSCSSTPASMLCSWRAHAEVRAREERAGHHPPPRTWRAGCDHGGPTGARACRSRGGATDRRRASSCDEVRELRVRVGVRRVRASAWAAPRARRTNVQPRSS
jgi:class 3 adenylate cyclase